MPISSSSIEMEQPLDAFYNLKKKIIELSVDDELESSVDNDSTIISTESACGIIIYYIISKI